MEKTPTECASGFFLTSQNTTFIIFNINFEFFSKHRRTINLKKCICLLIALLCCTALLLTQVSEIARASSGTDENLTFSSFEQLKTHAANSYEELTSLKYTGKDPLVIQENLQLPDFLCLDLGTSQLTVPAGVEFSASSWDYTSSIYAGTVLVKGTLTCDYLEVSDALTVEGSVKNNNVIYLDMASIKPLTQNYRDLVAFITRQLSREIEEACPDVKVGEDFSSTLIDVVERTGSKFVMVLDEWDAPIRENLAIQKEYLDFLRMLFKSSGTTARIFAAAYMTGILPIKKDGSQSAVSDFQEYSMIDPRDFAEYVGFTEDEVRRECARAGRSFESMKRWYDGYTVGDCGSMYNPYSVMQALATGQYRSYWKKTSAAETLMTYIDMDQDGLQDDVARLIAGESIVVDTDTFQNDVETFTCKDDVLALLIHLGYLTYEEVRDSYDDDDGTLTGLARIPNEEVRAEFRKILRRATHKGLVALVRRSDDLLKDTLAGNH
jgi:hypothetical protein